MGTVDYEIVQHALQSFVVEIGKVDGATRRARFVLEFNRAQTLLTKAVTTASDLVGLSQDVQTDGTF